MTLPQQFPLGWDETRIQKVITHYKNQTEEEALEEDESAFSNSRTSMEIPDRLVPLVRELLAKYYQENDALPT